MEENSERNLNQMKESDEPIPDLALTMQTLSLSEPGLCRIQDNQTVKQEILDFSCCLIMKVANTGATPRSLSQKVLEEALARSWKEKYYGITQVSSSVFMAHFKSQEDLVSVYIKQPWVASSENLLVDWFDPNMHATSSSDFKFDNILVTVRAYGIPRNKRSITLLKDILKQVGDISDFHVLQESNLFAKQDYIYGTAKLLVMKPLKDRVIVSFEDKSSTTAYLHYEKIKRACLFCGVMFHNVQDCAVRNNLISDRQKRRQSSSDIPAHRFGQWIINERSIPADLIHNSRMGDQSSNQEGLEILQRLRNIFSQDPKGKGQMAAPSPMMQAQNAEQGSQYLQHHPKTIGQSSSAGLEPLHNRNKEALMLISGKEQMGEQEGIMRTEQNITQQNKEAMQLRVNNSKRSAPTEEAMNQPNAKKAMSAQDSRFKYQGILSHPAAKGNQGLPTLTQCAMRAIPPYNPALSLAQNAQLMNKSLFGQEVVVSPGILGAGPSQSAPTTRKFHSVKEKRKPSRWDIQVQQRTSTFKPGANTWTRNMEIINGKESQNTQGMITSPCRSDASSAIPGSYEHDPWPLHTPTVSQGTHDTRLGIYMSPPPVGEPYYNTSNAEAFLKREQQGDSTKQTEEAQNSAFQNMMIQTSQEITIQTQEAGNNDVNMEKAEAPAFKAPRAP